MVPGKGGAVQGKYIAGVMFGARKEGEIGMIMIMIDIDMPDNCDECRFNTEYDFCKAMPDNFCGNTDNRKRPEWCPLKEQESVEGHWIPIESPTGVEAFGVKEMTVQDVRCSVCDAEEDVSFAAYRFCPRCGAKMEGR